VPESVISPTNSASGRAIPLANDRSRAARKRRSTSGSSSTAASTQPSTRCDAWGTAVWRPHRARRCSCDLRELASGYGELAAGPVLLAGSWRERERTLGNRRPAASAAQAQNGVEQIKRRRYLDVLGLQREYGSPCHPPSRKARRQRCRKRMARGCGHRDDRRRESFEPLALQSAARTQALGDVDNMTRPWRAAHTASVTVSTLLG